MADRFETKCMNASVSSHWKHETYYLEDAFFLFDNTLFKVPQLHLLESRIFQALLGDNGVYDCTHKNDLKGNGTIHRPFTCGSVSRESFALILRVLYPINYDETPQLAIDEWRDVLELSFKWKLDRLHSLAIRHLSDMRLDAVTKLELARRYGIRNKAWTLSAIGELVKKNRHLTEEDVNLIGVKMALRIAREQGMTRRRNMQGPQTGDASYLATATANGGSPRGYRRPMRRTRSPYTNRRMVANESQIEAYTDPNL
ncbi:hypothetical protein AX17_006141 [Amanita inopinata Kibby_2008]|nr:hypothetical protein AX17_006141 [Amanita inopinata Kibby_2008]